MSTIDSLVDICLEYLSAHIDLLHDITLPSELCDELVKVHTLAGRPIDFRFGGVFANTKRTKLTNVQVRTGDLTKEGLEFLVRHRLSHLDVSWCARPPQNLLEIISHYGDNLTVLAVGSWKWIEHFPGGFSTSPNLKKLSIYKWHDYGNNSLTLPLLLKPLTELVSLNLNCAYGSKDLSSLELLPHLRRLFLHKVIKCSREDEVPVQLETIKKLTNLTHLDISGTNEVYPTPDLVLSSIVESLPDLIYLDISGTNLPGRGVADKVIKEGPHTWSDILGLSSRENKEFQFLGLYDTAYYACRRRNIPAKVVTGDASAEQLVNAARAYMDRPLVLENVLNEIYNLAREAGSCSHPELCGVVLDAMERHARKKPIQISASASLFFVVKHKMSDLPTKISRRIVRALLNAMVQHREDQYLIRNGCLCLCQFDIPQELMFEYKRLVEILLYITTKSPSESVFVQRIAIYLLNSLACQVDSRHKHILGEAGAVPKMLKLIDKRLNQNLCDDVMEVAWSTLWNVTDETPLNCQYFLDSDGMQHFCTCLEKFPERAELLRNMMGLLGNVAEVGALRPRLMTHSYLRRFTNLLLSETDGIEVSYNAAGVLAHLCSDGEEAWTVSWPQRRDVLMSMRSAIEKWDLVAERNINYRSFVPILGLLQVDHTPECQHWAAWALANLTRVYPHKYCELVESEGGLEILRQVAATRTFSYPKIKELAEMVIEHCHRFKDKDYQGVPLEG